MFREGSQIGLYTLIRKLGRGGFGEVWLAERRAKFVTTKVAVKLPLDEQVDHKAIKHEATLWEQASGHPNILPIIDADEYDGQIVIVSEYAPDGSLEEWLKTNGAMPVERAIETTIQILDGLEFLHSRNIIHRDLKPANILLQGTTPRLADFGISRALRTTVASQSQNISGTFAYMSPEALDGKRSVQTDVWSVGVNLYQFLTGMLPFPQKEPSVLFPAIIMREFAPLPDSIPQSLKTVIAKALAKLPETRYKNADEMREDLRRVLRARFFSSSNYENLALKKIQSIQNSNYSIESDEVIQERGSPNIFETGTNVRPIANENSVNLSKSKVYFESSRPSIYSHSPEIRGFKLGMSLEELEHYFKVQITRIPDKLGCQGVSLILPDHSSLPYYRLTTFNSEQVSGKEIPLGITTIKQYEGYKAIHFKFLDEYIFEILFVFGDTVKWKDTEHLAQTVSKQLNISNNWLVSVDPVLYVSTPHYKIYVKMQDEATLKFESLEMMNVIKNRRRDVLEAVSKQKVIKDNDFLL